MGRKFTRNSAVLLLLFLAGGCASTPPRLAHPSEELDKDGVRAFDEARARRDLGEQGEALVLLKDLSRRYPRYFRIRRAMQDLIILEQGTAAAEHEAKAAVDAEENAMNLTLLARVTQDREERDAYLIKALELDPTYVWTHYASAYNILKENRLEEYEGARDHLEKALDYSATFHEARILLIENLSRLGEIDELESRYHEHISWDPNDMDTRYNFAILLRSKLNDPWGALEQLEYILAREPDRSDVQLLKGIVLTQDGEYREAERVFLSLSDRHPFALLNLAFLNKEYLNAPKKALRYFQEYLDYSGENEEEKTFLDEKILVPTFIENLKKEME